MPILKWRGHYYPDVLHYQSKILHLNWRVTCASSNPLTPRLLFLSPLSGRASSCDYTRRCGKEGLSAVCAASVEDFCSRWCFQDLWIRNRAWTWLMSQVCIGGSFFFLSPSSSFAECVDVHSKCTWSPATWTKKPSLFTALALRATDVWEMFPLQLQAMPLHSSPP